MFMKHTAMFSIISFKGMRDDLISILDEKLSSMSLCALHCKMRNTEQLLKSVQACWPMRLDHWKIAIRTSLNMVQLISRQIVLQSS